jgi:hypothetical protein
VSASVAIGVVLLLPPRGVLVQAVQQQLVEAPGLQEPCVGAQMESPRASRIYW